MQKKSPLNKLCIGETTHLRVQWYNGCGVGGVGRVGVNEVEGIEMKLNFCCWLYYWGGGVGKQ